jgi:DNA polymerase III sliding clamp (beta) subunit (PCNA family)
VIGKLPTIRNKEVEFEQDGSILRMTHGRFTRATFQMVSLDGWSDWMPFSPDDMIQVEGLAGVAAAVQWAASKGTDIPLPGVHFDGELAMATDRYRFAVMPFPMTLKEPITVPASVLTTVLKAGDTCLVRADGNHLYLMPDEATQISTAIFGVPYPPIKRVMRREYPHPVTIGKKDILETIDLACTMIQSDRQPALQIILGKEQIAITLANEQTGLLGSVLPTPGQLVIPRRHDFRFKPEYLVGAIEGCPGTEVTLGFDPDNPLAAFYVNGGTIEYWISPQQKTEKADD